HDLAVTATLELVDRAVGLAAELVADRRQRVVGDVQAERLLLQFEQLVLRELAGRDDRVMARSGFAFGAVAEVEDRALAEQLVGLLLLSPGERLLEAFEHPAPRRAGRVERTALDERLERALVDGLGVDALGEIPDGRERPTLLARPHDRAAGGLADVLHRVEAEADLPLDDGEVDLRRDRKSVV